MADLITAAQLRAIAGAKAPLAADLAKSLNPLAPAFGLMTPLRLAHFLAQICHESGGFRYVREIWGPTPAQARYEGRQALGNTQRGDGKRYMGRGLIQITGRSNAREMTKWVRARYPDAPDFESEPEKLETWPWAVLGALWFWDTRGLNALADADDVVGITRKINGGTNGLADRKAILARAKAALFVVPAHARLVEVVVEPGGAGGPAGAAPPRAPAKPKSAPVTAAAPVPPPSPLPLVSAAPEAPTARPRLFGGLLNRILGRADAAAPAATPLPAEITRGDPAVFRVQRALSDRGYAEVGELDGVIGGLGSKTRSAIRAAQADNGLDVTGEMDAAFLAALPSMPARAIPAARAEATVRDLRKAGSTPVAAADSFGFLGRILLGGGALGGVNASGILDTAKQAADKANDTLSTVKAGVDTATAWIQWGVAHWWILAIGAGFYAALRATRYALEIRALYRQGTITRAGA